MSAHCLKAPTLQALSHQLYIRSVRIVGLPVSANMDVYRFVHCRWASGYIFYESGRGASAWAYLFGVFQVVRQYISFRRRIPAFGFYNLLENSRLGSRPSYACRHLDSAPSQNGPFGTGYSVGGFVCWKA